MTRSEIAAILDEIGTLLELKGENAFRVNAYRNGARTVEQLDEDLRDLVADGRLGEVRGIGSALREKIETLVREGSLPYLEELRKSVPAGLVEMLRIPGLGAKKIIALRQELGITDVAGLKAACESGQVAKQKGFGTKTQEKILAGIAFLGEVGNRWRFDHAYPLGVALLEQLSKLPGIVRGELCGSLRRRRETAKDIDILLSSEDPQPIMDAFVTLPEVMQVTGHGETKSSVIAAMQLGKRRVVLNADLRIVADSQFAYALVHFTGNKDHNKRLREIAQSKGLKLNEYELAGKSGNVPCATEADVYEVLGLAWIPAEMREDTGEIELAAKGPVPELVRADDIQGVFHNHTTASDGKDTLEAMALEAKKLGLKYLGIADHSRSLMVARGLSPDDVRRQWDAIDELNSRLKGITVLKGTECDILPDGSLDYDDDLLAGFDYVVVSVHTHFGLAEDKQTERICRALGHPLVTMLGHPTGRLLLTRDAYKVALEDVVGAAAEHKKMIEINAQPSRLDLDWVWCKKAKSLGVPLVINPDAHSTGELSYFRYGVNVARRGWLTKADVFNTRSLAEVRKVFKGP